MRKIAVVDDELAVRNLIVEYISRFSEEKNEVLDVRCFSGGPQFLEAYTTDFDLVFLDIDMPGLDGMQTARELRLMDENISIIFVTNLARYAIKGYEVNALDFIVKPIQYTSFSYKLGKALRFLSRFKEEQSIFLQFDGSIRKTGLSEIIYIESDASYVIYHTLAGPCRVRQTLKSVEKELAKYGFSRCNHGYLVNLKYVTDVHNDTVTVERYTLKISRSRKREFISQLTEYLGRGI